MKARSHFGIRKAQSKARRAGAAPLAELPRVLPAVCNHALQGSAPAPLPNSVLLPCRLCILQFPALCTSARPGERRHFARVVWQTRKASFSQRGRSGAAKPRLLLASGLQANCRKGCCSMHASVCMCISAVCVHVHYACAHMYSNCSTAQFSSFFIQTKKKNKKAKKKTQTNANRFLRTQLSSCHRPAKQTIKSILEEP